MPIGQKQKTNERPPNLQNLVVSKDIKHGWFKERMNIGFIRGDDDGKEKETCAFL